MKKRVILIHGLGGTPDEGWIPWLKGRLENHGFAVHAPQMPRPFQPEISDWQAMLAAVVGVVDSDTYFVGHSLGCLAILHYLASRPRAQVAGGAVFVGGTLSLPEVPVQQIARIVRPWFERDLDFDSIRSRAAKIIAILSDDDPLVPAWQLDAFALRLGAQTVLEHGQGHYTWLEGIREAPTVLAHVLRLADRRKTHTAR